MPNYIKKEDVQVKKIQILAANAADGGWKSLAETLNVSLRTAYRWISDGDRADQRSGFGGNTMLDVHTAFCVQQVELNNRITLVNLKNLLK